ncbi:hypothetical protein BG004_004796 [Podila humilis]|nr:hypothetical protein BG004_004796 [Podila humilis]
MSAKQSAGPDNISLVTKEKAMKSSEAKRHSEGSHGGRQDEDTQSTRRRKIDEPRNSSIIDVKKDHVHDTSPPAIPIPTRSPARRSTRSLTQNSRISAASDASQETESKDAKSAVPHSAKRRQADRNAAGETQQLPDEGTVEERSPKKSRRTKHRGNLDDVSDVAVIDLEGKLPESGKENGEASKDDAAGMADDAEDLNDDTIEEDEEPDFIPDHIAKEIQEFEEGFNGLQGRYKLMDKIGEGTFSSVYTAVDLEYDQYDNSTWEYIMGMNGSNKPPVEQGSSSDEKAVDSGSEKSVGTGKLVAIKRIYVNSSPERIESEISMLHELSGHNNVAPLITAFRFYDQVLIVLPYFQHPEFGHYYRHLPMDDIKCYLRALLRALAHVHAHKIIHRDVKPSNFLYDVHKKTGILVDFGLAQRQSELPIAPRNQNRKSKCTSSQRSKQESKESSRQRSTETSNQLSGQSAKDSSKGKHPNVEKENSKSSKTTDTKGTSSFRSTVVPTPQHHNGATSVDLTVSMVQRTTSTAHITQTKVDPLTAMASRRIPVRGDFNSVPQHLKTRTNPASTTTPTAASKPYSNHHISRTKVIARLGTTATSPILPADSSVQAKSKPVESNPGSILPPSEASALDSRHEVGYPLNDTRPYLKVNRAGTRGFRAPEILLKHVYQTVSLDIWSVGVILLCFLTGRFPFFNSNDDPEALLEIAIVFGKNEIEKVAAELNRSFVTNIPSIKRHPIPFGRLARLLHPGRFAAPHGYIPKFYYPFRARTAAEKEEFMAPRPSRTRTSNTSNEKMSGLPKSNERILKAERSKEHVLKAEKSKERTMEDDRPNAQSKDSLLPHSKSSLRDAAYQRKKDTTLHSEAQAATVASTSGPMTVMVSTPAPQNYKRNVSNDVEPIAVQSEQTTNPLADALNDAISREPTSQQATDSQHAKSSSSPGTIITADGQVAKRIVGWDTQENLEAAVDFLDKLLALNPVNRFTAEEALAHSFLAEDKPVETTRRDTRSEASGDSRREPREDARKDRRTDIRKGPSVDNRKGDKSGTHRDFYQDAPKDVPRDTRNDTCLKAQNDTLKQN